VVRVGVLRVNLNRRDENGAEAAQFVGSGRGQQNLERLLPLRDFRVGRDEDLDLRQRRNAREGKREREKIIRRKRKEAKEEPVVSVG